MKTIILGAGPSGLGVALGLVEAGHQNEIILIEKENFLGGLSGSFEWEDMILDFGPHRFATEYPELVERFKNLLGEDFLQVPYAQTLVFQSRKYNCPPKIKDYINTDTITFAIWAGFSFLLSHLKRLTRLGYSSEKTFENIVSNRFGKIMYKKVIEPLCNKVWGAPKNLDPYFAEHRFSTPSFRQWGKKKFGKKTQIDDSFFYYPRRGFQQLWNTLADSLEKKGVKIFKSSMATKIHVSNQRISSIEFSNGTQTFHEQVDWLVSTIPTQNLLRLLKPNPFSAQERWDQKFINRGMCLVVFVINKPQTLPTCCVIFPEQKYWFGRLTEQNAFSRDTVPLGQSAVVADIITDLDSSIWKLSDEDLTKEVSRQIQSCGFFKEEEVVKTRVLHIPVAYPLPTLEREKTQVKLNQNLLEMENLICTGRFASSDYNNAHTALKKGMSLASVISGKETLKQWYPRGERLRKVAIRD